MKLAVSIPERPMRASAIEKSLFAMARAHTHFVRTERCEIAQRVFADDKVVARIIERGAAPIGTTTGDGWASQVTQNLVGEFLATLAPISAAAVLIRQGLSVRLGRADSLKIPARTGAPATTVTWIGEADPAPVRTYTLNQGCELDPKKFGFIIAISSELAERANGESVIRTLMKEDAAISFDASFFSTDAGDSTKHAGMLNGVAPLTGYGGGDRVAAEEDLVALSEVISAGGSGSLAFVVSPRRANRIRIKYPDLARELQILPSLAVADTTVIAVDPLSLVHGAGDNFDIEASDAATLHMSDDPTPIGYDDGGPKVAAPVRSMWQTNCIALRLLADVAFAPRRPNAVAWLQDPTW